MYSTLQVYNNLCWNTGLYFRMLGAVFLLNDALMLPEQADSAYL